VFVNLYLPVLFGLAFWVVAFFKTVFYNSLKSLEIQ